MMWYAGGGHDWWTWLFGGLAMAAFWGVVIWGIWYFATTPARRPAERPPRGDDPKRILDERLARGEIDAEEYRRVRDLLHESADPTAAGERPVGTGPSR